MQRRYPAKRKPDVLAHMAQHTYPIFDKRERVFIPKGDDSALDGLPYKKEPGNWFYIAGYYPEVTKRLITKYRYYFQIWEDVDALDRPEIVVSCHDQTILASWESEAQSFLESNKKNIQLADPIEVISDPQERLIWQHGTYPCVVVGEREYSLVRVANTHAVQKYIRNYRTGDMTWMDSLQCYRIPKVWVLELESKFRRDGIKYFRIDADLDGAWQRINYTSGPSKGLLNLFPRVAVEGYRKLLIYLQKSREAFSKKQADEDPNEPKAWVKPVLAVLEWLDFDIVRVPKSERGPPTYDLLLFVGWRRVVFSF